MLFQKMMAEKTNYRNNVKPIHSSLFLNLKLLLHKEIFMLNE